MKDHHQVNAPLRTHRARSSPAVGAALLSAMLSACGGGGSDAPQLAAVTSVPAPGPSSAQPSALQAKVLAGPFGGTLTGVAQPLDAIVVVASSVRSGQPELWAIYGSSAASDFKVAGLFQSWTETQITSNALRTTDAVDWNKDTAARWGSIKPLPIDLSLDPSGNSVKGSVAAPSGALTVTAAKAPLTGYRFVSPARLDSIQGRWELTTSESRSLSIDIAANGSISGVSGACTLYDSSISPTSDGDGVFLFRMRFRTGNSGCDEPHGGSNGVYGIAVAYVLPDGKGTQLVFAGSNGWDPVYLAAAGKR